MRLQNWGTIEKIQFFMGQTGREIVQNTNETKQEMMQRFKQELPEMYKALCFTGEVFGKLVKVEVVSLETGEVFEIR